MILPLIGKEREWYHPLVREHGLHCKALKREETLAPYSPLETEEVGRSAFLASDGRDKEGKSGGEGGGPGKARAKQRDGVGDGW